MTLNKKCGVHSPCCDQPNKNFTREQFRFKDRDHHETTSCRKMRNCESRGLLPFAAQQQPLRVFDVAVVDDVGAELIAAVVDVGRDA